MRTSGTVSALPDPPWRWHGQSGGVHGPYIDKVNVGHPIKDSSTNTTARYCPSRRLTVTSFRLTAKPKPCLITDVLRAPTPPRHAAHQCDFSQCTKREDVSIRDSWASLDTGQHLRQVDVTQRSVEDIHGGYTPAGSYQGGSAVNRVRTRHWALQRLVMSTLSKGGGALNIDSFRPYDERER